jgi:hypothetical protein
MGWYGTLLLAKPEIGNLPAYPGVRQAFGSWFATPPVHQVFGNELGLHDLGDGWQRVGVRPAYRERLRLAAGVQELAALGYPSGTEILPVVDPYDPAVGGWDITIAKADRHASELNHAASGGDVLEPGDVLTPKELDYLRFSDLVWSSVYGGGRTRDELAAEYEQLASRWPD